MKKIAITGASSGLGLGLANRFKELGWEVLSLSRTHGHNVLQQMDRAIDAAEDCDVFINNAYLGFYNVDVLYHLFERWKEKDKTIINIGSDSADGHKNFIHPYAVTKAALEKAAEQLQNVDSKCRVITIKPGYIDTARVAKVDAPKLRVRDVVQTIEWCLSQPADVYIRSISLRSRKV